VKSDKQRMQISSSQVSAPLFCKRTDHQPHTIIYQLPNKTAQHPLTQYTHTYSTKLFTFWGQECCCYCCFSIWCL